jgi:hypothetical protein
VRDLGDAVADGVVGAGQRCDNDGSGERHHRADDQRARDVEATDGGMRDRDGCGEAGHRSIFLCRRYTHIGLRVDLQIILKDDL